MKLLLAVALLFCAATGVAEAGELIHPLKRSVSRTEQFTIYCNDDSIRFAVSTFAEETKRGFLQLMGEKDDWKYPIILRLEVPPTTSPNVPPSSVQLYQNELGFKVQVDVALTGNLADARLPYQLVRAILLEYMHRKKADIQDGVAYAEPPAWLVQGVLKSVHGGLDDAERDVYKASIKSGRTMSLVDFLAQNPTGMDSTSEAFYSAYSLALIDLLVAQPDGRVSLARYIRSLPEHLADGPLQGLDGAFPALAGNAASVEKWWTLNVARLAASDRYRGLSVTETEEQLSEALRLQIAVDKGDPKTFELAQYRQFPKKPETRVQLEGVLKRLIELQTRTNALYRPVLEGYANAVALLIKGKTKGIDAQLAQVADERKAVCKRVEDIADYLNWYEANNTGVSSNLFAGYIRMAEELNSQEPPKRNDGIAKYLDEVEKVMQ